MRKKIILFEGLGSAGKTTLIDRIKSDLENEFTIEVLDNKHPQYASILCADNELVTFNKSKCVHFCFRWTKLFLFLNFIINSNSNLFIFDRGLLTNYIYGKIDGFSNNIIDEMITNFLNVIEDHKIIYKTVFVECDLKVANSRYMINKNIDVNNKIKRNELFAPYLNNISEYYFISNLFSINSTNLSTNDYMKLIQFIKTD